MMRSALISAITATLVFYSLHNWRDSQVKYPLESAQMAELIYQIEGISEFVAALDLELDEFRKSIANRDKAAKADNVAFGIRYNHHEIIERIESMEEALSESSSKDKRTLEKLNSELKNNFSTSLEARDYEASIKHFADAEDYFEADSGRPIRAYTDSIDQHLNSADGLDLNGMDCGKSICKVTYSKPESLPINIEPDAESELVDRLLFGIEGQDVDLRYADDPYGNRVLYIEMK